MVHPSPKKYMTHGEQVIKTFQLGFKLVTLKYVKNELSKNSLSILSLMISYENRKKLMYKLIGEVIYTIIDEYICIDDLGLPQENLSKHDSKFKNTKFNNFSRWEYLRF